MCVCVCVYFFLMCIYFRVHQLTTARCTQLTDAGLEGDPVSQGHKTLTHSTPGWPVPHRGAQHLTEAVSWNVRALPHVPSRGSGVRSGAASAPPPLCSADPTWQRQSNTRATRAPRRSLPRLRRRAARSARPHAAVRVCMCVCLVCERECVYSV